MDIRVITEEEAVNNLVTWISKGHGGLGHAKAFGVQTPEGEKLALGILDYCSAEPVLITNKLYTTYRTLMGAYGALVDKATK